MPTAGADLRSRLIVTGSCSISRVSAAIGGGIVAEKKSVCRLRRQVAQHAADVGQEAHVEHPVGFVEHEVFDAAGASRTGARKWSSSRPGVAIEHVDALAEGVFLRPHADPAVDGGGGDRGVGRRSG